MEDRLRLNPFWPFSPAAGYALHAALFTALFLLITVATTPIASHGRTVLLPTAQSASPFIDAGDLVRVSVTYDGLVFVDAKWYPPSELPAAIALAVKRSPACSGCALVVSLDRSLPFGSVRRLLGLIQGAGASHIILAVHPTFSTPLLPAPNPGMQRTRYARR